MNNQDNRVIKTREDIEAALLKLLQKKTIYKITVTELCQVARIHKSTFYRHYLDIPDLQNKVLQARFSDTFDSMHYGNFFDAPETFLAELDYAFQKNMAEVTLLAQGQEHLFFDQLVERLSDKIYAEGRIGKTPENDMRLRSLFSAILINAPKYCGDQEENQRFHVLVASVVRFFFPEHCRASEHGARSQIR